MSHTPPQYLSRCLALLEDALLTLLVAAMILLSCAQIGMRGLFASGLSWADPLLRHMVLWAGLLGAVVATRTDKHISMDLASRLVPHSALAWLTVLMHLFASVVCAVLTWTATAFVRELAADNSGQAMIGLAPWHLHLIFPIAFGLITLRFLERAILQLIGIMRGSLPGQDA